MGPGATGGSPRLRDILVRGMHASRQHLDVIAVGSPRASNLQCRGQ